MKIDNLSENNSKYLTHPKYRADIDGLRAIAVLSVVAFHAFPHFIRGGLIGVDIFFVISGYLISTIIIGSLEKNSFSFKEFYVRRISRIFPSLLVVLIFSILLGWTVLLEGEYKQLGKHIAGGAGFVSNFVLWTESGYFDNSAETKPLLHLWSLGVEEQFYIVWPLLLWVSWKKKANLLAITIVCGIISFSLNIASVHSDAVKAFYSPQTRFWELMMGSSLAYMTLCDSPEFSIFKKKIDTWAYKISFGHISKDDENILRNARSLLGGVLIIIGIFVINKERHFPGWLAILPTLGAVLIISAGAHAWLNRVFLSHRLLVWFGLISFPLYLWHWPLLSFLRIMESEMPSRGMRLCAILTAVALSWLTFNFIEKPIRFTKRHKSKYIILILLMATTGLSGYLVYICNGLTYRTVVKINVTKESGFGGGWDGLAKKCGSLSDDQDMPFLCRQDNREEPRYVLFGDSKAGALAPGLFRTSHENGRWMLITSGVAPLIPVLSDNRIYRHSPKEQVQAALSFIGKNKNIETVVIAASTRGIFGLENDYSIEDLPHNGNYDVALKAFQNTIDDFIKSGKHVILLIDNPTLPHPEDCMKRTTSSPIINSVFSMRPNKNCRLEIEKYLYMSNKYRSLLINIEKNYPLNVEVFDTTDILCQRDVGVCLPFKDEHLLYGVSDHISDYASGLIGQKLNDFVKIRQ